MKDKTFKRIRICSCVALVFCVIWAVLMTIHFVEIFKEKIEIDWSQNTAKKVAVISCYLLGTVAMIALSVKVVINILKGLRENIVFPQSNVKLMFWVAIANFFYLLGSWNQIVLWDNSVVLQLQPTNFVSPFCLLFFAFMYKVAADAVEENNLTI